MPLLTFDLHIVTSRPFLSGMVNTPTTVWPFFLERFNMMAFVWGIKQSHHLLPSFRYSLIIEKSWDHQKCSPDKVVDLCGKDRLADDGDLQVFGHDGLDLKMMMTMTTTTTTMMTIIMLIMMMGLTRELEEQDRITVVRAWLFPNWLDGLVM